MRKRATILLASAAILLSAHASFAHFGMVIPSTDIVSKDDTKEVELRLMFMHPFEGQCMEMEKPASFGVMVSGKKHDLAGLLEKSPVNGFTTWKAKYRLKRPGDHVFYMESKPYWEGSEETFIVHYTKVVVSSMGLEDGWDREVGLKTEIVPLTRTYGLWSGNVFQGVVKLDGRPVPFADVEVEYFNEGGKLNAPSDPYVTQVVKADNDGVFTYAMPRAGWWGFAALSTDNKKLKHKDGKEYPVEIGAVIWVRTRDMR